MCTEKIPIQQVSIKKMQILCDVLKILPQTGLWPIFLNTAFAYTMQQLLTCL